MNVTYLKSSLLAATLILFPLCSAATEANQTSPQESFQGTCVKSWMKRMDKDQDKTDYRNFGEKYCECAAKHPLDNEKNINKAMQLCMSQTLLQDTMDSLENEVGLDKVTDEDLDEYCADRFKLVFPKMNDKDKQVSTAYCDCAKPRLIQLIKDSEEMTDAQYGSHINEIAATCSSGLENPDPNPSTMN